MSFVGSVVSLDRRSSVTSGRLSIIQDRLSGLCRVDLRQQSGRRLLLLQLLLVPSIPLILLTSFTLWKLIDSTIYVRKLGRFNDAILEQKQRELAVSAVNDELLTSVYVMTGFGDPDELPVAYAETDLYVSRTRRPQLAGELREARRRLANGTGNGTLSWPLCQSAGNLSFCYDVIAVYDYVIAELSRTDEELVTSGLPHEVYSHWYAARALLDVRSGFVENCVYGELAMNSTDRRRRTDLDFIRSLEVVAYHIQDIIALDRHQALIFADSARSSLDRLREYNYQIATGSVDNYTAALVDWNALCRYLEVWIFPAMRREIYYGLHNEGIQPTYDSTWSLLGMRIFALIIQFPLFVFIVENGRITSISIFSSVNMFSSRVAEIRKEKTKTESLLKEMLPKSIARQLLSGKRTSARFYDQVTIFFSDIVDFNDVSRSSKPVEIVKFLNDIYGFMDSKIECYDVYKVETISSIYMVASGLPVENGDRHVTEVASMSLDLMKSSESFNVSHLPGYRLQLRVGIHTGSCCAGVVGNKMPRYCLFGDTVNTASRMQSSGEALKIQITTATYEVLNKKDKYVMKERGQIAVKGKGMMITYWLLSEKSSQTLDTTSRIRTGTEQQQQEAWGSSLD